MANNATVSADLEALNKAATEPVSDAFQARLLKAHDLEKWPIAQLISVFERNTAESMIERHRIVSYLDKHPSLFNKKGSVIGITGTPGAGKSSLIGELCTDILTANPDLSIAVLAVDPSSQVSGGSLLGDRTRIQFPANDNRLFFRSQASELDLGGMGKQTFHVIRLLRRLFDLVIIETVGIGQSEIEVQKLADLTCLVMQPLAGDQIQFMKAGIMEVPDVFIVNKCDEESLAKRSLHMLKASLKLAQIHIEDKSESNKRIFLTSATKRTGIGEVSAFLQSFAHNNKDHPWQAQEDYFLLKWVRQAYGEFGIGVYEHFKDRKELNEGTFEQKELSFQNLISDFLTHLGD